MRRKDILKSPEYWIANIQIALYNCAEKYMKHTNKNRTQLAQHLGVSKGYVTQVLSGDYDHKLSKLVELSLAFGYVPKIDFVPIEEYLAKDVYSPIPNWEQIDYKPVEATHTLTCNFFEGFSKVEKNTTDNKAA